MLHLLPFLLPFLGCKRRLTRLQQASAATPHLEWPGGTSRGTPREQQPWPPCPTKVIGPPALGQAARGSNPGRGGGPPDCSQRPKQASFRPGVWVPSTVPAKMLSPCCSASAGRGGGEAVAVLRPVVPTFASALLPRVCASASASACLFSRSGVVKFRRLSPKSCDLLVKSFRYMYY